MINDRRQIMDKLDDPQIKDHKKIQHMHPADENINEGNDKMKDYSESNEGDLRNNRQCTT